MKKIRVIPLIICICLLMCALSPAASALEDPSLVAKYVVLADLDSGRILYSKDKDVQVSPASLTKIMTALLAVEAVERGEHSWDEMVTAGADCRVGMDESSSTAGIVPGEVMSYKDLIYCAMLPSANEACNILGTCISGSISSFVERMNERAAELGCTNTQFKNPNGLTATGHYSSAYDMYLITAAAIKNPTFMEICNTISYVVPATNMAAERKLANSNALISEDSIYNTDGNYYLYEGAAGVKTGFTQAAGYCLISTVEREGIHMLAVIMGSTGVLNAPRSDYGNFEDSVDLYDWAFENFSYRELISTGTSMGTVDIALADGDPTVMLHPQSSISALLPNDTDPNSIELKARVKEDKLVAPLAAGEVLGEVDVYVSGEHFGTVRLVTNREIELSRSEFLKIRLQETFDKGWVKALIIIVLLAVAAYMALVIHYRRMRRRHLEERRRAAERRRLERERYYREMDSRSVPEPTQRFTSIDPEKLQSYEDYYRK